jgi:hypothetical protein
MAYANLQVDLSDIDTWDLVLELQGRRMDDDQRQELAGIVSASDIAKFKLFLQIKDKYTVQELEQTFKENLTVTDIPKEQLKLDLP